VMREIWVVADRQDPDGALLAATAGTILSL
jgi:hypothetical protein